MIFNIFKSKKSQISKIEKFTNGVIREINKDRMMLKNCFVSRNGIYVGNFATALEYLKLKLIVHDNYPQKVAVKLKKQEYEVKSSKSADNVNNIVGYVGISDYGSVIFRIGDKQFDPKYVPKMNHFSVMERVKYISKMQIMGVKPDEYDIFLKKVVPYNQWGTRKIENHTECLQSALKFSYYMQE